MDFELSEEQLVLREAVRDFLVRRWDADHMRRALDDPPALIPPELWKEMAALGWIGIAVSDDVGGGGSDVLTASVLAEESGRGLLPATLSSVLAAAIAIDRGGGAQRTSVLPALCAGDHRVVCAIEEPGGAWGPDAVRSEAETVADGWVLSGTKILVPDSEALEQLLVAARTPAGLGLVEVPVETPGITVTPMRRLDAQSIAEVVLDGVVVPASALIGGPERADATLRAVYDIWTVLSAADLLGVAEAALDLTTAYATERRQFGRPIGSFQAVSHRLADLLVDVEISRSLVYAACLALDEDRENAPALVSAAKTFAGDTAVAAAEGAVQLHGGIGFTWELDVHLYLRRALAGAASLGDSDFHRDRIARVLDRYDTGQDDQP